MKKYLLLLLAFIPTICFAHERTIINVENTDEALKKIDEIYNDLELMYAIKKALDRKVHFDIMIQSEEPDEKSFRLVSLLEDSKYAGLVSFEKNKGIGLNHNVCTVDSNKFRFEYNPDERKAEASWNDEATTHKLNSLLDSIKNIAC